MRQPAGLADRDTLRVLYSWPHLGTVYTHQAHEVNTSDTAIYWDSVKSHLSNTLVLSWKMRMGTRVNKENGQATSDPAREQRLPGVLAMTPRPDWGRGSRKKGKGPGNRHSPFASQGTHTDPRAPLLTLTLGTATHLSSGWSS